MNTTVVIETKSDLSAMTRFLTANPGLPYRCEHGDGGRIVFILAYAG